MLVIATMTVPLFLLARTVFHDPRIARLAVLLFVLEISAWHHAHRVHGPGTMGAFVVLVWIVYLAAYHDSLYERAHLWIFAVLSATAALSYTASLVQLCIFAAVLLLLLLDRGAALAREARRPRLRHGSPCELCALLRTLRSRSDPKIVAPPRSRRLRPSCNILFSSKSDA